MNREQYARLIWWKVRLKARQQAGGLIGAYVSRTADRWARKWREAWGLDRAPMQGWLLRRGAGNFWLPIGDAPDWSRSTWTEVDQEIADATASGTFELLGSGPVDLGEAPAWRRDLYSGTEWPLKPSHRIELYRGDGSDIRTVWELSRFYHVVALARAYWQTGESRYPAAFVRHVDSWIEDNPLGRGPHWASPMDAAIRAANWIVGMVLFARVEGIAVEFWQRMLANLYATGLFLEQHLEWHPVYRGNHFVSNGVGLLYLGTLLRDTHAGARWFRKGAAILTQEIQRQVGEDGVAFEASLAYHRLDTEFFAYGGELLRRNGADGLPADYEDRLTGMYRFISAYLPVSGEAPMLGDADDGRLHAVSAEGFREPRRHALGLPDSHWPSAAPESGRFPGGGFFVLRHGRDHLVVRCGRVGLAGAGSHDHNDQLSFELVVAGRRVVADSGTYAYTRDLRARFAFRATAAHSVVQIGTEEQNPIRVDRPWRVLDDRTRSACTEWEVGPERLRFGGQHSGYAHRPSGAVVIRTITADVPGGTWTVQDRVEGTGTEPLSWRLHLAETVDGLSLHDGGCEVVLPGQPAIRIRIDVPAGMTAELVSSEASERYGERRSRSCLLIRGEVRLPAEIMTTVSVVR